jgi:hypothetical protein
MATTTQKTTNASRIQTFIWSLFAYLFGVIFKPITTFRKLLADRQRLTRELSEDNGVLSPKTEQKRDAPTGWTWN